jgi:Holliday junction DNA helicase RuvA
MINYVRGILSEIEDNLIIVEAGGIGYGINVPASLIGELPKAGSAVRIYTYFSVKEDSESLYGFINKEDRDMFRQLISVNGVGPKGALAILSVMRPDDLRLAIATGDSKSISRAQGIGAKTAERVILELKNKVGDINAIGAAVLGGKSAGTIAAGKQYGPVSEAMDALIMLGYSRMEAGKALSLVNVNEDMPTEEVLRLALKNIKM